MVQILLLEKICPFLGPGQVFASTYTCFLYKLYYRTRIINVSSHRVVEVEYFTKPSSLCSLEQAKTRLLNPGRQDEHLSKESAFLHEGRDPDH